jgi:hypothetical protein
MPNDDVITRLNEQDKVATDNVQMSDFRKKLVQPKGRGGALPLWEP